MKRIVFRWRLLLIICVYLVFRLINLTLLPIFNDEAIYLDWGWREITIPGNLFYSLYDAKQPLIMWFFGISMHVFQDSLFAGRIVSVIFGMVTLVGIYKLGKEYFTHWVGIVASLLYIVIPLFSFFDRQALMETAVSVIGVWSLFFFLRMVQNSKSVHYQIWFGFILGLGMMIKTSISLFIVTFIFLLGWEWYKKHVSLQEIRAIGIKSGGVFLITAGLLFIQPLFWQSLTLNSKYSLSFSEVLHLPLVHTLQNILINTQIIFIYMTPLVVVCSLLGIYLLLKNKKNILFVYWFLLLFLLQAVFVRESSQRYVVSFLPVLTLFAAYALHGWWKKSKTLGTVYFVVVFTLPIILSGILLFSPPQYFFLTAKMSNYSDISGYLLTSNSGYGVKESILYLKGHSTDKKIYVTTALNTGNPESAVRAYLAKDPNVSVVYFDSQMFDKQLHDYDCLQTNRPFFFVSRDEQQAELNKFFTEEIRFNNSYGKNSIGIYTLKPNCKGKVLPIDLEQIIQYENQQ